MGNIKKIFYFLIVSCSMVGLCFSIIGITKFPERKALFIIAIYSCVIGAIVGISEIIDLRRYRLFEAYKIIIGLLSGIALILASIYLFSMKNTAIFMKIVSIVAALFFSVCIIKGLKKIKVEHYREIILSLGYKKAFEKAREILKTNNTIIMQENPDKGFIVARTKASWKSFGEEISIQFTKINDAQIKITVTSKPVVSLTSVDFGKNLKNIERFCNDIVR